MARDAGAGLGNVEFYDVGHDTDFSFYARTRPEGGSNKKPSGAGLGRVGNRR